MDATQLKIWQCKCGGWNSNGLSSCGHCGAKRPCSGGGSDAIAEPVEQDSLVAAARAEGTLFAPDARLDVTIERHAPRKLDDDNFIGGCKQLRDALAEALGRKGDAERDGLEFHYVQKNAPKIQQRTVIRIVEKENGR